MPPASSSPKQSNATTPRRPDRSIFGRFENGKLQSQFVRIARNSYLLQPRRCSCSDRYISRCKTQPLCQQVYQRCIGLSVFRNRAHPCFQVEAPVISLFHTFNRVPCRFRRQPHKESDAVTLRAEMRWLSGQTRIGAIVVQRNWRMKNMINKSTIGEISMPPRSGRKRRMGRSAGSVTR